MKLIVWGEDALIFRKEMLLAETAQRRDVVLHGIPGYFGIEAVVAMNQMAAHSIYRMPIDLRMRAFEFVGEPMNRLPDLDQTKRTAILERRAALKGCEIVLEMTSIRIEASAVMQNETKLVVIALSLPHRAQPRLRESASRAARLHLPW